MRWFALVLGVLLGLSSSALAQDDPEGGSTGTTTGGSGQTGPTGPTGTTPAAPPPSQGQAQQAPPPHSPPPAPPPREREEEGDGRAADLLWIEGAFGYSYANLVQFNNDDLLPSVDELSGSGLSAAVAAGIRISFLAIGARGTLSSYPGFDLWSVGGEVHLRIPLPTVEPYVRVGAGYAFIGQANYSTPEVSDLDVFGLMVDAGAGVDFYLDKIVAIGFGMDAAYLNLSRQRIDMTGCGGDPRCGTTDINFQEDGDAAGLQLRAHGHISLHF